ncbi:MAG: bifunctional phosphoribosyl-AMP cyclohydrolase/phosphoribosyl-ATP diphosphatase HisIE [Synergistaceae bacterium]|nr:bifunctional phosphoribosyl-AMP cyclohydrolase/phosphoribosyl-ATP diphosphatase HisIE [Synergistaceae bacterium]
MQKIEGLMPAGLTPAIVQDFYTGRVLMLAYVNQESYEYMLQNGETCFWSRSRNQLWHKGETSGDVQKIINMAFDCDNDTLLIQVRQTGKGACHTGQYSCFGDAPADFDILDSVYAQIQDRQENPMEKSYTNYLLTKGIDKILKKIGEETAETIVAAKNAAQNGDKTELIDEISDLAYHVLVMMFTQGVTLRDVRAKLSERHSVKGNLKRGSPP